MNEHETYHGEVKMGEVQKEKVTVGHNLISADRISGRFSAVVETLQPIHVSSGILLPPERLKMRSEHELIKSFFRAGRRMVVPAASFKGAIRSLVEAFTHSCAPATREAERPCFYRRQDKLCPACRIFGAMGFRGAFRFDDAGFLKGVRRSILMIPPQYQPKPHIPWRRHYPHRKANPRERTWPVEAINAGSKMRLQASFTNLTSAELGAVLVALGQGRWEICPKIGAGKSSGLGSIHIEALKVEQISPLQSYTSFETDWQPVDIDQCIRDAEEKLIRADALDKLAKDMSCKHL